MILAFIFRTPYYMLKDYTGERPAAFILTILSVVLTIIPVIFTGVAIADDARDVIGDVNRTQVIDFSTLEDTISDYTGAEVDIQSSLTSALQRFSSIALGDFSQVVNIVSSLGIGIALMVFLMYYFLKDGSNLIQWLKNLSPLPEDIEDNLVTELDRATSAVMKGHILVAMAQGFLAGIGLAVFGIPNYLFWIFIMVILGLIPIVGTMIVWLPAAVYLVVSGEVFSGLMLAVYGFVVVGMADNILRPIVVDKSADLHPSVIILGVLGGVTVFGMPGLFIGPIIFGVLKSVLTIFRDHYEEF